MDINEDDYLTWVKRMKYRHDIAQQMANNVDFDNVYIIGFVRNKQGIKFEYTISLREKHTKLGKIKNNGKHANRIVDENVLIDTIIVWPNKSPTAPFTIKAFIKKLSNVTAGFKQNLDGDPEVYGHVYHINLTQPNSIKLETLLTNTEFRDKYFEDKKNKIMMKHVVAAGNSSSRRGTRKDKSSGDDKSGALNAMTSGVKKLVENYLGI
jgi:valyl-tRNA synthetase